MYQADEYARKSNILLAGTRIRKKIVLTEINERWRTITNVRKMASQESFDRCVKIAQENMRLPPGFSLRPQQFDVLRAIFDGKDTIAVLPTGFGKSLIFQMLPFMMAEKFSKPCAMIVIVVAPINAIMEEQVRSLRSRGIMACSLSYSGSGGTTYEEETEDGEEHLVLPKEVTMKELMEGKYNILYTHPEVLFTKPVAKMIRSQLYHERLCGIVIDEVHMVAEWGQEFRPMFQRLGEITCLHSKIAHLALTATATPLAIQTLADTLMFRNHKVIAVNPDRPNIFLDVCSRPPNVKKVEKINSIIEPLAVQLEKDLGKFPLTICYVENLEALGYCYQFLSFRLREKQYNGESHVPENRIFAQYHTDYTSDMKKYIIGELSKVSPKIRLVLATVALGMGLNAPSVEQVIHMRPPVSLENYLQETGRAGRSGQPAKALMHFNNSDIASNRKGMTKAMVEFCKNNEKCLRLLLVELFGFNSVLFSGSKEDCCRNCRNSAIASPSEFLSHSDFNSISIADN